MPQWYSIDTTTGVATLEQMCFMIRYVNEKGSVKEKLVALTTASNATGLGMFQVFLNIMEKYCIDWRTQLCDLRSRIQPENSNVLYVWCFAHQLNLVVVDMCDCCTEIKVFLGNIQSINDFMRARKRTQKCVDYQNELYPELRLRPLKHFSTTRWTSHDRTIIVIYEKFKALKATLKYLSDAPDSDRDISSRASSLVSTITSFKFIISMIFMQKIFSITTPLSKFLQSKSLCFIQAIVLVNEAKKSLSYLRTDEEFFKFVN